jgi:hypothetical protein
MNLSKCQEGLSQPELGVFIPPFPLLAVMSKMRTSRTVRDGLMGCPRLNSNGKKAKSTVVRETRWAGRTVRQDPADHPRVGRRPSVWSTRAAHHSVWFEVNSRLSAVNPRTVRPEVIFSKKLCQKPQIINKLQRPVDRPPQGPALSAPQQKTNFSHDFQWNSWNEITTHLNAMHANSWSKWHYEKSSQWNWSLFIVRLSIQSIRSFIIL